MIINAIIVNRCYFLIKIRRDDPSPEEICIRSKHWLFVCVVVDFTSVVGVLGLRTLTKSTIKKPIITLGRYLVIHPGERDSI